MHRKVFLYLSLMLLTQCSKCKRDDPAPQPPKDPLSTLPPETQSGNGTFGCLINGQAMSVKTAFLVSGDWSCPACLTVAGQSSATQPDYVMSLILAGSLQSHQVFPLVRYSPPVNFSVNQFAARPIFKQCFYSGDYIQSGQVELVKFDGVARIAAGRFAYTLYEPGGCDTLRVTNGRFDVKF
jgi:hypothetical protein